MKKDFGNIFRIVSFVIAITLLSSCVKPEVILLCDKGSNADVQQVLLIKNMPDNKPDLDELMRTYNADFAKSTQYGKRTFLKEHDNVVGAIGAITLHDNIDYEETKCEEIDNMDIVLEVSKFRIHNGADTISYYYFEN